jgi:large subunit ribosomal protein L25
MKSVEIIGYNRANLGKADAKQLREQSLVPAVLYGGAEQVHFAVPMILFRQLVYTPNAYTVALNIEGKEFSAILQDVQFHPVNELILHADFMLLNPEKEVKMDIPVQIEGTAVGVTKGGKLNVKLRKLKVVALPANLPDSIPVDVSALDLGKTIKVGEVKAEGFKITNAKSVPVVSVDIPRALRGKQAAA